MPGVKRTTARIKGAQLAAAVAASEGARLASARHRRRWTQQELADRVGLSRSRLAGVEAGRGATLPLEVWFALAQALGLYLRFEWARDPQAEISDAGHLDIQELVLRVSAPAGWERAAEARSGSWGSDRSIDVRLIDRGGRRLAVNECWNTFGDLGAAMRSSDRKVDDAMQLAVAIAGDGEPYQVGLCWVVRDTRANRALVDKYQHIFVSRFPGSSAGWVRALTEGGSLPKQPGLIWCDLRATRLFARRRVRVK